MLYQFELRNKMSNAIIGGYVTTDKPFDGAIDDVKEVAKKRAEDYCEKFANDIRNFELLKIMLIG